MNPTGLHALGEERHQLREGDDVGIGPAGIEQALQRPGVGVARMEYQHVHMRQGGRDPSTKHGVMLISDAINQTSDVFGG